MNHVLHAAAQVTPETGWLTGVLLDFARGGAEWVLWLLVVLSLASVATMVERFLFYRRNVADAQWMRLMMIPHLEAGHPEAVVGALRETSHSMEARVLVYGLENAGRGQSAVSELMAGALARERVRYDRNLGFLATLGNNAPFIGLFGTVLGIIQAFDGLGGVDMSDPAAASAAVMGPIAEALVATGVGLLVAIPAVVAYNFFRGRVKNVVSNTELLARTLLAYLEPAKGRATAVPAGRKHVDDVLFDRVSAAGVGGVVATDGEEG